ncbi:MAG: GTP cyclohydrolase [Bacteroidota bacterium]
MIILKEISTKKEIKQFVKFPFKLYKNNPYWVPPLIKDEVDSFDKTKNPVFEHADARFYLAYKNNEIVGRIAAIINSFEVNEQNIRKMRFGWMDMIDDIEVSKALLSKIEEIGKENKLDFIEGPVGFSNLDKVGVLTEGFEERGTMITWYNHPYYKGHLEELGYRKEKKYLESYFFMKDIDITNYERLAKIVAKRNELKPLNFTSSKQIMPYVDEMFELFSTTYSKLASFVPISDRQIAYFKEKFIGLIDPEFIKFVVDKEGKMVSFSITLPSFAEALQKSQGKLFPFGFLHFLNAKKNPKESVFYLIGIKPEYQKKGVTAIIFDEFYKTNLKKGIIKNIQTPELEENEDIQLIWKNFNPTIHKRRCTYRKEIG